MIRTLEDMRNLGRDLEIIVDTIRETGSMRERDAQRLPVMMVRNRDDLDKVVGAVSDAAKEDFGDRGWRRDITRICDKFERADSSEEQLDVLDELANRLTTI